jgi:iron complex transport system substrate-binding protein
MMFVRAVFSVLAFLGLACAAPAVALASDPPVRIVSNNMCTDQLLLALADRSRIAALSPFARNPALSFAAEKARGIPRVSGTSEDLLVIKPDLVLTSQFDRRTTVEFIKTKGTRVETFELVKTVEGVKDQLLRMGRMLGSVAQAQEIIAQIDLASARLRAVVEIKGLRVLPLARRGWSAGPDTLIGDILRRASFTNVAEGSGASFGSFLSLETVISLKPDVILLSAGNLEAEDNGTAMLLHPALARLFPPERQIILPDRLTVCGGPMIIEAMDALTAQLHKVPVKQR